MKSNIATNSLAATLVPMTEPALTISLEGIPMIQAIGANTYPSTPVKEIPKIEVKIQLTAAINPT